MDGAKAVQREAYPSFFFEGGPLGAAGAWRVRPYAPKELAVRRC